MRLATVTNPGSSEPIAPGATRGPRLAGAAVALTAVVLVAYPLVALVGSQWLKTPIWETAGLAAAVCWFASLLALCVFHYFRQAGNPAGATLGAMLLRMGIPLAVVFLCRKSESKAN